MATADSKQEDAVFQKFRDKNKNNLLPSVRAHRVGREFFVDWQDIKLAFSDIDHMQKFLNHKDDTLNRGVRVLFEVEQQMTLCTPVRVKYSSDPYTVIMKEDVLEDNGEMADIESNRLIGRMFQEELQLRAWFDSMKTADYDAIIQAMVQTHHCQMEMHKRYTCKDTPEGRALALPSNEISSQFDVDRIYSLREPLWCLDFAAPRLFLVLPADLNSWNDNDPLTHSFRLYFLCDFKYRRECDHKSRSFMSQSMIQPKHIHLSSHPGYDLMQSHKFFRKFGHLALEILRTIKVGYQDEDCDVPALSTFGILKHCDDITVQHLLCQEDLGPLVDKSIAYIQEQSDTQPHQPRLWVNGPDTRQIWSFLHLPEGDNGMGGLIQTLYPFSLTPARWLCSGHAFEHSSVEGINNLIHSKGGEINPEGSTANIQHWQTNLWQGGDILQGASTDQNGWHIDLQLGTISVSLKTVQHAYQFTAFLKNTKRTFDLSIHLAWRPLRSEIKDILEKLVECNVRVLQIDASNLDFLQDSPTEYTRDLFVEHLGKALFRPGQFVILCGYPQESQMYIYLGISLPLVYGFLLDKIPMLHVVDWWEIQKELYKYHRDLVRTPLGANELSIKFTELSSIVDPLVHLGLQGVDVYSLVNGFWELRFGVQDGAIHGIVACTTPFLSIPITESVHLPLQRIIIQYNLPESRESLFQIMDSNPSIRQIDIPAGEDEIYELIESIGKQWHGGPNPLEVTIYEQGLERVGRKLATVIICKAMGANADNTSIDIKKWDCSYISRALLDRDAKILEVLAQNHLDALESFTLNVSLLKEKGLTSIWHVLRQSRLVHLTVECTAFDTVSETQLGQVLGMVQWSTIKSLKLRGHYIDAWIKLWSQHSNLNELPSWDHQLLRLHIVGWGMPEQELSHESAVWLHSMIYLLSPVEVQLQNIQMKESGDQELIRDVVNDPLSISCIMVNSNKHDRMLVDNSINPLLFNFKPTQTTVTLADDTATSIFQNFKSRDDTPFSSLQTHVCLATGQRFIWWSDIQMGFDNIDHLQNLEGRKALFMIDGDGELYDPLRIKHDPSGYIVVYTKLNTHLVDQQESVKELGEFVRSHSGQFDIQQDTVSVELRSTTEADQFTTLLIRTGHVFNISITLIWAATRFYGEELCRDIAQTGTEVLDLHGIIPETLPDHLFECPINHFANIMQHSKLQTLILLDYPQPQEHWIHIGQFSFLSKHLLERPSPRWIELRSNLETHVEAVLRFQEASYWKEASKMIHISLEKNGFSDVKAINIHHDTWAGTFDLEQGVFLEVYSSHLEYPVAHLASVTLQRLTVDLFDVMFDRRLHLFVQDYKGLYELNISTSEHYVPYYIESVIKMWLGSSRTLRLTLFERVHDGRGRVVAQLLVPDCRSDLSVSSTMDSQKVMDTTRNLTFIQWNCSHSFSPLSDYAALLLDTATGQHPLVLTSLTLDISKLSPVGFLSMLGILSRSRLKHLHVLCTAFGPTMLIPITHVLQTVQWGELSSLFLSGDSIEEWIQFWATNMTSQLQRLDICGTGSDQQTLSHSSVLAVQKAVYESPVLVELNLSNIELRDKHDWAIIVDSIDPVIPTTFGLNRSCYGQFVLSTNAVDLYNSRFFKKVAKTARI
ncbi:MAG: hypothetical protein BYD32DRAFT_418953 [Podila humilis]|nr:MAG: hypothetical protein BYD32DRAFT_418953 [Podila humilis]